MDLKLSLLRKHAKQFSYLNEATRVRFLAVIELLIRCPNQCYRDVDFERVGSRFQVSGRSVRRWLKGYQESGPLGLIAKKAKGRIPRAIKGHQAKLIHHYASRYGWGSELIHIHLLYDHKVKIGRYRIRRYLDKNGFIEHRRKKKKSKHIRKVVIALPGEHTQMDVKYYPTQLKTGEKAYIYNFKDHATRWTHKKAFASFGVSETKQFMHEVLNICPFEIHSVQTDNGSEFTNRFLSHIDRPKEHALDTILKQRGIRHRLIPPGEKELQGLVERSHREDEQELYRRMITPTLRELNLALNEHCIWANESRRRKALKWETAQQAIMRFKQNPDLYQTELENINERLHHWKKTAEISDKIY